MTVSGAVELLLSFSLMGHGNLLMRGLVLCPFLLVFPLTVGGLVDLIHLFQLGTTVLVAVCRVYSC